VAKRATRKPAAKPETPPVVEAAASGAARRASVRRRPRSRVRVLDTETREEIGRLLDLSDMGLRLEGARALRDGLAMDLMIDCATPDDPGRQARIGVQVRWSAPGVTPGHFESGLRVKAMVSKDAEALRALYARLAAAAKG